MDHQISCYRKAAVLAGEVAWTGARLGEADQSKSIHGSLDPTDNSHSTNIFVRRANIPNKDKSNTNQRPTPKRKLLCLDKDHHWPLATPLVVEHLCWWGHEWWFASDETSPEKASWETIIFVDPLEKKWEAHAANMQWTMLLTFEAASFVNNHLDLFKDKRSSHWRRPSFKHFWSNLLVLCPEKVFQVGVHRQRWGGPAERANGLRDHLLRWDFDDRDSWRATFGGKPGERNGEKKTSQKDVLTLEVSSPGFSCFIRL